MSEEQTFTGSGEALLRDLVGDTAAASLDDDAVLTVLEFLDAQGATIKAVDDHSDSLEVRLGGPVFISVQKFVWGSLGAILSLGVAIATSDPKVLASAAQVVGNLLASVSIFPADTTEFKVYSAVAALQRADPQSSPQVSDVGSWLEHNDQQVSSQELQRGLQVLLERQLLRRAGEDRVRIVW